MSSPEEAVGKQEPRALSREMTSDENLFSILSHLSLFFFAIFAPLVIMLTKGKESEYTRHHAVEALNFQINLMAWMIISSVLSLVLIGLFMLVVIGFYSLIIGIIATMKSSNGVYYRYPMILRLVK